MDVAQFIKDNSKPLPVVLSLIAAQIHCEASELIAYANEDQLGGYHWKPELATFKQGSLWGVEGQILYALVRHFKPEKIVEIGGWAGCSGAHLASAVLKNGIGHVYSVDNEVGGQSHGADLPEVYRGVVTLVSANGEDWLPTQNDGSIDLLFEDADHSADLVEKITRLALRKVKPGGVMVNHDAMHKFAYVGDGQIIDSPVGDEIQTGIRRGGAYFSGYLAEPSDCGIAVTVIPGQVPSTFKDIIETRKSTWPPNPLADDHLAALSQPEPFGANSPSKLAALAALQKEQVGNANIESVSEPPAPETEADTKETPVKKTRKPRTPKAK